MKAASLRASDLDVPPATQPLLLTSPPSFHASIVASPTPGNNHPCPPLQSLNAASTGSWQKFKSSRRGRRKQRGFANSNRHAMPPLMETKDKIILPKLVFLPNNIQ
jgi:hypothetical protein